MIDERTTIAIDKATRKDLNIIAAQKEMSLNDLMNFFVKEYKKKGGKYGR